MPNQGGCWLLGLCLGAGLSSGPLPSAGVGKSVEELLVLLVLVGGVLVPPAPHHRAETSFTLGKALAASLRSITAGPTKWNSTLPAASCPASMAHVPLHPSPQNTHPAHTHAPLAHTTTLLKELKKGRNKGNCWPQWLLKLSRQQFLSELLGRGVSAPACCSSLIYLGHSPLFLGQATFTPSEDHMPQLGVEGAFCSSLAPAAPPPPECWHQQCAS